MTHRIVNCSRVGIQSDGPSSIQSVNGPLMHRPLPLPWPSDHSPRPPEGLRAPSADPTLVAGRWTACRQSHKDMREDFIIEQSSSHSTRPGQAS